MNRVSLKLAILDGLVRSEGKSNEAKADAIISQVEFLARVEAATKGEDSQISYGPQSSKPSSPKKNADVLKAPIPEQAVQRAEAKPKPSEKPLIVLPNSPEAVVPPKREEPKKVDLAKASEPSPPTRQEMNRLMAHLMKGLPMTIAITPEGGDREITLKRNLRRSDPLGAVQISYNPEELPDRMEIPGGTDFKGRSRVMSVGYEVTETVFGDEGTEPDIQKLIDTITKKAALAYRPKPAHIEPVIQPADYRMDLEKDIRAGTAGQV